MSLPAETDPTQLTPEQQLQYAIDAGYPLQTPPSGVIPNFENGETTAYQLYITAGVCIPLVAVFSLFRLLNVTRLGRKTFAMDETDTLHEVIFVLGFVLCLAFIAMTLAAVDHGVFGHHAWDVRLADVTQRVIMLSLLLELIAPLAICAVKISVLTLYLRIFGSSLIWMRVTCVVGIVLLLGYHISFTTAFGVMCAPDSKAGYSQVALLMAFVSDKCVRTRILVLLMGIGNTLCDLVLLLLPLPVIWNLQMPLRRKLKTSAVFLIGISACIASLIGLATRVQYYSTDSDQIRIVVPLWATAMAEMAAGILICCGPSAAVVTRAMRELPAVASWMSLGSRLAGSFGGSRSRSRIILSDQPPTSSKKTKESSMRTFGGSIMPREGGWPVEQPQTDPRGGRTDVEVDAYSLRPLKPIHSAGIRKMTDFNVSRTEY
ncbi:putative Integral membrane protein [Seiridium unicorne]|uniref:Integral membrane protein n=1 Tax=Seiridium unicorne TaxID=138068 RepID=A0ABR2UQL8_9PEZI